MSLGIIMENDSSELIQPLCEKLGELGLIRGSEELMSKELIEALNVYRESNGLITLDFCDPVTLRTLGIECGGDEFIYVARCAEALSETELECYDICRRIANDSRRLGLTLTEAADRYGAHPVTQPSSEALRAAILAFLDQ